MATWRVDGFASLVNGGDRPGVVTTEPLVFEGDRIGHRIRWSQNRSLSSLTGKTVRLRFHLDDGNLYSYRFHD